MTRAFFILLRREIGVFFFSPMACIVFLAMALFTAVGFWQGLEQAADGIPFTVAHLVFNSYFFWVGSLVLVPVLTMRLFSEEARSGTLEVLMTAPVRDLDVILAKFLASYVAFAVVWASPLVHQGILQVLTGFEHPVDPGPFLLMIVGVLLIGGFFLSIGVFCSSLTKDHSIAAILTFIIIVGFFSIGLIRPVLRITEPEVGDVLDYFSSVLHLQEFSEGLLDSRRVVFYLSGVILFLGLTQRVLAGRRI